MIVHLKKSILHQELCFHWRENHQSSSENKYNITHTYTLQSVTSATGRLLKKCFHILHEKENEFGR